MTPDPRQRFVIDVDFSTGACAITGPPTFEARAMWDFALAEARRLCDVEYAKRIASRIERPNLTVVAPNGGM